MTLACETRKIEYISQLLEYITKDNIATHTVFF